MLKSKRKVSSEEFKIFMHHRAILLNTVFGDFVGHPDAVHADDRDADGGGNRLHCLLLSHQHCLGKTRALQHYFVIKTYIYISITLII